MKSGKNQDAIGNVAVKIAPPPGALAWTRSPPCARTSARESARPSPSPAGASSPPRANGRKSRRAKTAIGRITGQWGSDGRVAWKRSVAEAVASATGKDRPLLVLHLFGSFDQELC